MPHFAFDHRPQWQINRELGRNPANKRRSRSGLRHFSRESLVRRMNNSLWGLISSEMCAHQFVILDAHFTSPSLQPNDRSLSLPVFCPNRSENVFFLHCLQDVLLSDTKNFWGRRNWNQAFQQLLEKQTPVNHWLWMPMIQSVFWIRASLSRLGSECEFTVIHWILSLTTSDYQRLVMV